jgi:uncharacterized protein YjeT (DUF2065 family)
VNYLNEGKKSSPVLGETIITAISIGFFLVLVGILFVITPNLFGKIIDLISDFRLVDVPNTNLIFPGPAAPSAFSVVYVAAAQFSFALGVFQVVVLALRFFYGSAWRKRAETVGNLVFWLGTGFLIQSFLIGTTQWFVFWSTVIMMIGVSLIARAGVMAVSRMT